MIRWQHSLFITPYTITTTHHNNNYYYSTNATPPPIASTIPLRRDIAMSVDFIPHHLISFFLLLLNPTKSHHTGESSGRPPPACQPATPARRSHTVPTTSPSQITTSSTPPISDHHPWQHTIQMLLSGISTHRTTSFHTWHFLKRYLFTYILEISPHCCRFHIYPIFKKTPYFIKMHIILYI